MTTIVYDHINRQIAVDGLEVAGDEIKFTRAKKHYRKDGVIYFIAGSVHDVENFLAAEKTTRFKPEHQIECTAIAVNGDRVYKCRYDDEIGYWEADLIYSDSIGSGGVYARCALDFNCNARKAIEYAATRDIYTNSEILVYSVDKGDFL